MFEGCYKGAAWSHRYRVRLFPSPPNGEFLFVTVRNTVCTPTVLTVPGPRGACL